MLTQVEITKCLRTLTHIYTRDQQLISLNKEKGAVERK